MKNTSLILMIAFSYTSFAQTSTLGNQTWMTENLDVVTFRNGDSIPEAKTDKEWQLANEQGKPAWCYYLNKKSNGKKFGKIYNGYAISDSRKLAPIGFHIPTVSEWSILLKVADSNFNFNSKKILNKLNFNLKLGGYRFDGGSFNDIKTSCFWWSSTEYFQTKNAYVFFIEKNSDEVVTELHGYDWGFYVRCIRD